VLFWFTELITGELERPRAGQVFTNIYNSIRVMEIKRNLEIEPAGATGAGKAKGSGEPEPFGVQC
jgi:hypothetical protein